MGPPLFDIAGPPSTAYSASMTASQLREDLLHHLKYSLGKDLTNAGRYDLRMALSLAVRDRVIDPWFTSTRLTYARRHKRVYFLSMEFLIGRLLEDGIVNLGLREVARDALDLLGLDLGEILQDEPDAALGNGGLGRLAACFLDSMSTLGCPAYGYGIRYEHGLFQQRFDDAGRQVEEPEEWLRQRHAWEFERPEAAFPIGFGGGVEDEGGRRVWRPSDLVVASAYDTPIIGWKARWSNTLRLWGAASLRPFDFERFNFGDYIAAAESEALARTLSRVLYPDDSHGHGKELRLKQEYFLTAASIRDILRRFRTEYADLRELPRRLAIQLNDTHPAIAGPELIRLLHDELGMEFEDAEEITRGCLSYTNHTLLPEAQERWSRELFGRILPRHLEIIERVDAGHARKFPGRGVGVLTEGEVRMGELSFILAHRVNGVSAMHTELVRSTVFRELNLLHPGRIVNQTNGITPRRWLRTANPGLSNLITDVLGDGWVADLEQLEGLVPHLDDARFLEAYAAVKRSNKLELANWISRTQGVDVDPASLFDVQIKRIHEYKRQLLNLLETIALWNEIRESPHAGWVPRVKLFGGKAAPGYVRAKEIIHLTHAVGRVINADPLTRSHLTLIFPPNYNVSMAEIVIPGSDLSEQISTAGMEASGTGNMKFALNGALTIGTLDGANVEIRDRVGAENFFLFGMTVSEVESQRNAPGRAEQAIAKSPRLARAIDQIARGDFTSGDGRVFEGLVRDLREGDPFFISSDFDSYWTTQREVDQAFLRPGDWNRRAALNTARMGWFSSDRTIRGYMREIWRVTPIL